MGRRNICGGTCSQPPELPTELSVNKLINWCYRHQWKYIAGVVAAGTAGTLMSATVPFIIGKAVDQGVRQQDAHRLIMWGIILGVLTAVNGINWATRHRFALGIHIRTQAWFERIIAARALDPRGGLDNEVTPGELVSHVSVDSRRVSALLDVTGRGSGSIIVFFVLIAAMYTLSWQLATAIIASVIPLVALLMWRLRALEIHTHAQQKTLGDASSIAADIIGGARVVKGVDGEHEAIERYDSHANEIYRTGIDTAYVRAQTMSIEMLMPTVVVSIAAWLGGHLAIQGKISPGELITLFGWTVFLMTPLLTFGEMGRKWAMARGGAARLIEVLQLPHATVDEGDVLLLESKGALQTSGSLPHIVFAPGAITAIVADAQTSNAMADAIGRLYDIERNTVMIDGIDACDLSLASLRQTLLVAEHDAALFEGSLSFNLAIARPGASESEMLAALHTAGGDDIVELLDDGLEGAVFERGRSLSGGQRQRVALARALLAQPPVLVLMDPTSALDSYTEAEIIDRLPQARAGKTTIIFSLSPALLSTAQEVLFIEDNSVIARGSHGHLIKTEESYANLFSIEEVAS